MERNERGQCVVASASQHSRPTATGESGFCASHLSAMRCGRTQASPAERKLLHGESVAFAKWYMEDAVYELSMGIVECWRGGALQKTFLHKMSRQIQPGMVNAKVAVLAVMCLNPCASNGIRWESHSWLLTMRTVKRKAHVHEHVAPTKSLNIRST